MSDSLNADKPVRKPKGREAGKAYHRQKIIDAAITSIAQYGFAGTTVTRLKEMSGLSRGMVNLHFSSKDQMLVEVLKDLASEYRDSWKKAVASADDTPVAKLTALIKADFTLTDSSAEKTSAWLAYRVEAKTYPEYLDYCDNRERELFETVVDLCEQLKADGNYAINSTSVALGLTAMSEGLWSDFLLHQDDFDSEEAVDNCLTFLRGAYPQHF